MTKGELLNEIKALITKTKTSSDPEVLDTRALLQSVHGVLGLGRTKDMLNFQREFSERILLEEVPAANKLPS